MKHLLLDTNVVIAILNGRPAKFRERLATELEQGTSVYYSSVVDFELRFGIAKSARRQVSQAKLDKFLTGPYFRLEFDFEAAARAGELRAHLERLGTPIGPFDLQIAGQALASDLVLVTSNTGEFSRVPKLVVEDWAA